MHTNIVMKHFTNIACKITTVDWTWIAMSFLSFFLGSDSIVFLPHGLAEVLKIRHEVNRGPVMHITILQRAGCQACAA